MFLVQAFIDIAFVTDFFCLLLALWRFTKNIQHALNIVNDESENFLSKVV